MARAHPQYDQQGYPATDTGEWQDLRSELVALLDQVETQVTRTQQPEPGYQNLTERMRDLRHQVTEIEPETRHREALRSVQRAVAKFSDRDDSTVAAELAGLPPNPRDTLESAIQQIRSRHFPPQAVPQPQRVMDSPRFDELAEAVGGVSGRLERLEGELRAQARGQSANVKDIAEQVGQLSQVVELLAGAVGETGQVKRLESQIAGLARLVSREPQIDAAALTRRLDDVSHTVAKLAELQKAYADKSDTAGLAQRLDDVTATVGRLADLQVRLVERSDTSTISKRLDDVTATVGKLADLQVQLVDKTDTTGLSRRLDDVTATMGRLADLQVHVASRVESPRDGVKEAMQAIEEGVRNIYDRVDSIERQMSMPPAELEKITDELQRFAAAMKAPQQPQGLIELIDALNQRISDMEVFGPGAAIVRSDVNAMRAAVVEAMEPRLAALEQRIETITDKVAQGPELSIGQLEAQVRQLVARMDQTGEQLTGLARLYSQPTSLETPDLDALADLVAQRTSAAIAERVAPPVAADDSSPLAATIREVNERLARLELSVSKPAPLPLAGTPAFTPAPPRASVPAPHADSEPVAVTLRPVASKPIALVRGDAMPASPAEDAPLYDRPYGDPTPLQQALEAKNGPRRRHPGLDLPGADTGELPPAPVPSIDFGAAEAPARQPEQDDQPQPGPAAEAELAAEPAPGPNRSTFIAAARRAMRENSTPVAPVAANVPRGSLFARTFAGFQAGRGEAEAAAPAPASKPAAVARLGIVARYRTLLLGGVTVLAVLALANLFIQHSQEAPASVTAEVRPPAKPVDPTLSPTPLAQQFLPPTPPADGTALVIQTTDKLQTASIDPAAARGFTPPGEAQPLPPAIVAATDSASDGTAADAATVASLADPVVPLAATPGALESPVKVELPPEAIGPAALRQAAANGDARAQFEVATIYTEGHAVPVDMKSAAIWYERAASQGFAPAMYRLGSLYEAGKGVGQDLARARIWYQQAAEAGNRMAMHNLATLYAGGAPGTQQFGSAAKWFEEAASRGMQDSQFNLGMLYARGLGVKQDPAAAYKWFALAAGRGDAAAAKARDDIALSLDAATRQTLDGEVAAWTPAQIDLAANFAPIGSWMKGVDPGAAISETDVVKGAQLALARLGFDVGTPDGIANPKTAEAIKAFEHATGMTETGTINSRLLAVLGSQPV